MAEPARTSALPEPRWFAVMTRPGAEFLALRNLDRLGVWTFFPFDRVRRRRKRPGTSLHVVEWVARPYLSRYVFVALRYVGETLATVNRDDCNGVATVLKSQLTGIPLQIPTAVIDLICARAMVRFGEVDRQWFAALMRELAIDIDQTVTLHIGRDGRRQLTVDPVAVAEIA